jgi:hypothetical protein
VLLNKQGPLSGTLAFIFTFYIYTKIPLSLIKIKKEVKIGEEIFVNNIHFIALMANKSNLFFLKTIRNQ